ncbi:uncharacterized protein LOC143347808 [Colletes latitarsis]|uniref:uncharacterized protein LOC143347808 n=1 Tax=Colletes latitarsis TaxID=2605962 RepID=UPI004035E5D7
MTLLVYILIPTIHLVIDIVTPTNRSQGFLFELDYGVNSQQYFYYLTIHSYIGTAIVCHLLVSCYTMFVMYAQHAYALFAIVSYQLRTVHTFHKSNLINVEDDRSFEKYRRTKFTLEEYEKLHDKLFACIQGHKNALKYSYFLESLFTKLMIFQLFFSVLCLSTTGIYTVLNINNVSAVIRNGTFAFAQVFYIFSICFPGQRLMDHSKEIYTATCEIMWYKLSKKSISLYKFLLARSLVSSKLTALKVVPLTMETFIMIIQTAMSYFTVLKSTIDTRNEETSF